MPFDPLKTDEPLTGPVERQKDFEAQLMAGCTTIGLVSLITYGLTVWPFTVIPDYTWKGLWTILAVGPGASCVLGVVAGRRFGLAGSSGFFGGALAGAVFMHLRLQQTLLGQYSRDLPKPEYSDAVGLVLPMAWFVVAALVAWAACRREPSSP